LAHDDMKTEIGLREAARRRAVLAKDLGALEDLLDDQLVYVHSSGVADTKTSYLDGLRTGIWNYHRVGSSQERYVFHGETALVFCRLSIDITVSGTYKSFESNALMVWVFSSGRWRLAAVQSSGIPV